MHLSDFDLRQIDVDYLRTLSPEQLRVVAEKLLLDLKAAREWVNQTPQNSSRPPSSRAPWEHGEADAAPEEELDETRSEEAPREDASSAAREGEPRTAGQAQKAEAVPVRKAGKQPGSPGVGRTQTLAPTERREHVPERCRACGLPFEAGAPAVAYTARQELDLERSPTSAGLRVSVIEHAYYVCTCRCGHVTRAEPQRAAPQPLWQVELSEWHLVGPELLSLILSLTFRLRASRARVQEFLHDWLGLHLSIGTLQHCVLEAGRAVEPLEDQLVEELRQAEVAHVDETAWRQGASPLWLWVFVSAEVSLYLIAYRTAEMLETVLKDAFPGWLMSDGYHVYRTMSRRLRCWAHLIRKARGLAQCLDPPAQRFGQAVLDEMTELMQAVYAARERPGRDLVSACRDEVERLRALCQQHREARHEKARALARELLNDWEAIFQVLAHPELPLTNNEAERALRHWVIARKLSFGTRTAEGSRAYGLLASVIDTCRKRQQVPWGYLAQVIRARRAGQSAPPLPAAAAIG
jgi:transposase